MPQEQGRRRKSRYKGRSSLSDLSTARVIRTFERAGWQLVRGRGRRHSVMCKEGVKTILSVPRHRRLKQGLILRLIKDAGLTPEEFLDLY